MGVNAIWLNPIFESGWFDGGYDVIDFYKVDSRFSTNSDLVDLVRKAHKRDIKVCLDLVAGHTSDKCAWFAESMEKDANQRYSDYYTWSDTVSDRGKKDIELGRKDPLPGCKHSWCLGRGECTEGKILPEKLFRMSAGPELRICRSRP